MAINMSSTYNTTKKDKFTPTKILVYAIINQICLISHKIKNDNLMKFVIPLMGSLFKVVNGFL